MMLFRIGMLMVSTAVALNAAVAQLEFQPDAQPQCVFAGAARNISVIWHNPGDKTVNEEIRTRIFQTTSATAVLLAEADWKKLEALPQQTLLESAQLDFPAVKAETKFLVQWIAGAETNGILGETEVRVYPTNLLAELNPLMRSGAIGVFDPQNELKPLLTSLPVKFEDLENTGLTNFSGKLAVLGPFANRAQVPRDFSKEVKALAWRNTAVVWIQPAPGRYAKLLPSFYTVMEKANPVIIVQPELVADLPDNPQSQRNLIELCKLTLNPEPPVLPEWTVQP